MKQNNFVKVLDQECCSLKMTKNRNSFHNISGKELTNASPLYCKGPILGTKQSRNSVNGNGQVSRGCGYDIPIFQPRIQNQMIIVNGILIWIMISGKRINQIVKKIPTHVDTFQQVQAAIIGEQRLVQIWIHLLARLIQEQ